MKIKKSLAPFIKTKNGFCCPICHSLLKAPNPVTKERPCPDRFCNTCSYFFVLRANTWITNYSESYNLMEVCLNGIRVWIFKNAEFKIIKIGEFKHITCVVMPLNKIDFNNMNSLKDKIKTILTFS